ncbi:hypothetical protein [Mucilaginibacter sp. dw_454]|uniref:hypothetical protein n=1 Tax=Mucilaginibacter sp. dw_454 TaxID=2720079 RepID=UPI001BD4E52C|nr:hypothetical protein [Mucilaginibacter sp. dw_454]
MKSRVYNIALTALISLVTFSAANAQTVAPVPATPPVQATPATPAVAPAQSVYVYTPGTYDQIAGLSGSQTYAVAPLYNYGGSEVYMINPKDSVYRKKMQKLQEQMHDLNRQMSELNADERKKNSELFQQKMLVMRKANGMRFDSLMSRNFNRSFSGNYFHFNNAEADANFQKQIQSGDVKEKSKTFSKSYSLDGNDAIQVDNNYGKITVNTWAKKEVKVDVDIKAYANEDGDAQKLLDQTTINSSKDNNLVAFKTDINQGQNSWWGTMTQNGKITKVRKVIINYTIYMPAKAALTVNNRYGAVNLPDLDGKLNIKTSYGGLVAKALTNTDNVIVVKYGDANIGSVTGSQVNVSYGSLALDQADNLNATASYSPVKIGKLTSSGTITIKYGDGLVINNLGKGLKTLDVNSTYAPVKLMTVGDTNADFDVTTHYGDFLYDNSTNVTSKTPDNERGYTSTKNYKGHVGKGSADKVITIKSNYSNVKFD